MLVTLVLGARLYATNVKRKSWNKIFPVLR